VLLDDGSVQTPRRRSTWIGMDRQPERAARARRPTSGATTTCRRRSPAATSTRTGKTRISAATKRLGDNLTPDQEDVDDMGKALGVEYQDNEELQGSDKVVKRDAHRWELDPASSDDYKDRR
jgi:hypothetical protein